VRRAYYSALSDALLAEETLPLGPAVAAARDGSLGKSLSAGLLSDPAVLESEEARVGVLNEYLERRARILLKRDSSDLVVLMVTESILDSTEDTMQLLLRLARDDLDDMITEHYTSLLLLGVLPQAEATPEDGTPASAASADVTGTPPKDVPALFFQPGKKHIFSPRVGCATTAAANIQRLKWYRHVGRLIGLCVLHNDLFPINFSRHVLKFLLDRKVRRWPESPPPNPSPTATTPSARHVAQCI